jgi:hypothetical protein
MTAESDVAPSPNCMFIAHIVNDTEKSDSVWLHTHGLNRCGTIELEILGANMGNWRNLGNALNEIAYRLIGDNKFIDEKEPITVGVFADNKDIVVTWQRSEWALRDFPKGILGGVDDRNDEHSINMGVVYVYASEKDAMNGKLTSILKYAEKLTENTVYYKTTAETQRMRALALERVEYMKKISASLKDCTVLIKIGLTPDPEYGFDDDQYEYIWFEADEMGEDTFKATLTQDAYYVEGMTEGVQREFLYSEIVDWRVFNDEETFTPDDVYLFDF